MKADRSPISLSLFIKSTKGSFLSELPLHSYEGLSQCAICPQSLTRIDLEDFVGCNKDMSAGKNFIYKFKADPYRISFSLPKKRMNNKKYLLNLREKKMDVRIFVFGDEAHLT